jgi:hypothetical protein
LRASRGAREHDGEPDRGQQARSTAHHSLLS